MIEVVIELIQLHSILILVYWLRFWTKLVILFQKPPKPPNIFIMPSPNSPCA
ncbi:hypothetical protein K469DRAFT_763237 [Zopfia rhizophila CBS 207.26]|uniref:Uncharacterized protein n=1 Tax=Zopfia rhizophila CBS 207.26 TaxID=1314779 RepID=A0A6A6DE44_9PEZI|nr:hypothetical protein K469DRAFT_763237 [Zopfia rhizophila CBS 207.26]